MKSEPSFLDNRTHFSHFIFICFLFTLYRSSCVEPLNQLLRSGMNIFLFGLRDAFIRLCRLPCIQHIRHDRRWHLPDVQQVVIPLDPLKRIRINEPADIACFRMHLQRQLDGAAVGGTELHLPRIQFHTLYDP